MVVKKSTAKVIQSNVQLFWPGTLNEWQSKVLTGGFYCTSSYASTVLGVVILSVYLSVCHMRACDKIKQLTTVCYKVFCVKTSGGRVVV